MTASFRACVRTAVHVFFFGAWRRGCNTMVASSPGRFNATRSGEPPAPEVLEDFARGVVARGAGHATSGMRSRAAEVHAFDRHSIPRMPKDGTRAEKLVQRELAVEDVATHEPEFALEIERRQDSPSQHRRLEVGREAVHVIDDGVGGALALRIPGSAAG